MSYGDKLSRFGLDFEALPMPICLRANVIKQPEILVRRCVGVPPFGKLRAN